MWWLIQIEKTPKQPPRARIPTAARRKIKGNLACKRAAPRDIHCFRGIVSHLGQDTNLELRHIKNSITPPADVPERRHYYTAYTTQHAHIMPAAAHVARILLPKRSPYHNNCGADDEMIFNRATHGTLNIWTNSLPSKITARATDFIQKNLLSCSRATDCLTDWASCWLLRAADQGSLSWLREQNVILQYYYGGGGVLFGSHTHSLLEKNWHHECTLWQSTHTGSWCCDRKIWALFLPSLQIYCLRKLFNEVRNRKW